ncbi:MAG: lipoyl(octanoyl) transferase LipB [Acidobacteriota bacterium]|nr:lipoyl(octanoyl) transferase LipB [Blastocatellia bacterium]MDW8411505.1 lipoyl(octanoyl) transferase LipB [Acidobacteriota bacterium]
MRLIEVTRLGLVDYTDSVRLQNAFVEARKQDQVPDQLFLLSHPHVVTFGRNAKKENLTATPALLERLGIEVHDTGRGGDVTYHGPGQIVGYPILNLAPDRCDVHRYVRDLEEVIIRVAVDYGITANRLAGFTGVWVRNEKLAAIGVRISRWVTMHGFALNVNTDLEYFNLIIPCGIKDKGVTSLQKLLHRSVDIAEAESRLIHHFSEVFARPAQELSLEHESVQVVIYDDTQPTPQYLLLRRTPQRGNFWQPVTGRIKRKYSETPLEAALREVAEETGLEGEVQDLNYVHSFLLEPTLMNKKPPRPQINREYSFAMKTKKSPVRLSEKEHCEYAWLSFDEAFCRLIWPGNKHAFELVRRLVNHQ